jgi:folate-dependent phosphoribosylglycinamide formyltransferase PurN
VTKLQKDWAVLVSQTASEVIAISEELGFFPSLLITNNLRKIPQKNLEILGKNGVEIRTIPFNPVMENYLIPELLEKKLITLHGFLRILPPGFFNQFKGGFYNGHPGLITKYPELKGKDPQVRAWEGKYPTIGSVVHKVTEGVDEGEVVNFSAIPNVATTLDEVFYALRSTSLEAWKSFFTNTWKFE